MSERDDISPAELMSWHDQERRAWRDVRSSNEPGYCERMEAFHRKASACIRALIMGPIQ